MDGQMRGLTLVELLVCVALLAILLVSVNVGGFAETRDKRHAESAMTDIVSAIAMARQTAVNEATMVTFCRSDDGAHCQGQWHDGSIVFTDRNGDRQMNGDDRLLSRLQPLMIPGSLKFRSFGNKQYLQMTPFGMTNYQNGNFTYCPENGDANLARQVIISFTGRTRYARDKDGDGIVENSQGEALAC